MPHCQRAAASPGQSSRLGVVTSRKIGGAVARSRARRLLRESFRLHQRELAQAVDLVHDGPAEFGGIDRDEEDEFLIAIRNVFEDENAGRLSHGFDDEDAGHDREIGVAAVEEWLVDRADILDADDAFRIHFEDAIDQQEWVAMRQDLPNLVYIHD